MAGDQTASLNPEQWEALESDFLTGAAVPGTGGEEATGFVSEVRSDLLIGSRVRYLGDYELLAIIGQGGMGVVYRARQISLNRVVALKLIRNEGAPSPAEIRRFQHEAEAVASLDHPGIVPIYEVGTHEDRHYFSMKLISGESLQKARPSLKGNYRAIGRIIADAAQALQHAHERGILHRDIKPANLLLDAEGNPHLTDFGLAKRIDPDELDLTQTNTVVGTPAYMAPEQVTATRGMITTATDIYGLGAVLYALLSGRAPHSGTSVLEVLDSVREEKPEPPSKVDAKIPRDLVIICMKCLEIDPGQRYHSAGDLADDLNRWLDGRPISARSVSPARRGVMWCKRKPLIAGLAAALLISAVAGSTGILINWREARRQRDELARSNLQLRSERDASRQLNEFLVSDLLAWSSPFLATRRDVPVSSLLDRSATLAASRFASQPKIEGSIRQILGHAYLALGMLPKAEVELQHSLRIRQSLPEEDELDRLSTEFLLARLRFEQGLYEAADKHASRAFEGRRRRLGETDQATLEAAELVGALLKLKGKVDDSRVFLEKTAATARQALGEEHRVTLSLLTALGVIAHDQGRIDESSTSFVQLTLISTRVYGVDHPDTLFVRSRLGVALHSQGNLQKAQEVLEAVLGPAREILGPEHPETLRISGNLAAVQDKLGWHEKAAKGFEETLQGQKKVLRPDHTDRFTTEINIAVNLLHQGKPKEAESVLRDLIARMQKCSKPDHRSLGQAFAIHANALWDLDQAVEAESIGLKAIEILLKTFPPDSTQVVDAEGTYSALLLVNGNLIEAEKHARKVFEYLSRPGAVKNPWRLGTIKCVLGSVLVGQERFGEAEKLLKDGYDTIAADHNSPRRVVVSSLNQMIRMYESWGKLDEAARWRARDLARSDP